MQDDPKIGHQRWETILTSERPPLIDRELKDNGVCAVGGLSMGAGAAGILAVRHPDISEPSQPSAAATRHPLMAVLEDRPTQVPASPECGARRRAGHQHRPHIVAAGTHGGQQSVRGVAVLDLISAAAHLSTRRAVILRSNRCAG
ncbi:alpha/beta hydrolase-fold protein [Nocardia sp. R16R-3T]